MIISLLQMGYYNDLNIRSSVVPQMVFGLAIVFALIAQFDSLPKKRLLILGIVFWGLNSVSPVKFYYDRFFILSGQRNTIENPHVPGLGDTYYDLMEKAYEANGKEVVRQYSLRRGTFFEKYLLNKY
jgi:hypothetical protein